ncbi:MAG: 2-hydroxyacyl-CoA dehydratase family protein [Bdellovibrionota bacterium]
MSDVKEVMKRYFLDLDAASRDPRRLVAWCTSVGPAEILRAMDFEVFFPENHGAMLGASRMSGETIPAANALGYSPDICSYLTSDVGACMKGVTPLTKAYGIKNVPRPDVLVYNTNQCKDVMHWFEFYSRKFNVPLIGIHSPNHLSNVEKWHIDDVVAQFKNLIARLEALARKKMDVEKLKHTVALSKKATDLWNEVLLTGAHKPSPLNFFDSTVFMGPIVVLRGTEEAVTFYKHLLKDMKERIKAGVASVHGEMKRIYWDGMPVWGRLRNLSELFQRHRACVVASTYCNSWIFSAFDATDPLASMAKAYLEIFINRNDSFKEKYISKTIKEFAIDGVIFHESKTCPNNTNSQYNLPGRLRGNGIPSVVINGDLCDLRCFSDEQATNLIEAFLEMI